MKRNNDRKNVIAAIQARMGSTRLPQKVMRTINGKTMVECIWRRLKSCNNVDMVVLATSHRPENDPLVEHAKQIGIPYVRGSEEDLIQRHSAVLETYAGDALVRITADCPLVDPLLVDRMVEVYCENVDKVDLVTNILPRTYPKGLDTEIIPLRTFRHLGKEVTDPRFRELTTSYIMEHQKEFTIKTITYRKDLSQLRWTVDYQEDLDFVQKIYEALDTNERVFTMDDILAFLEEHPEVADINKMWIGK